MASERKAKKRKRRARNRSVTVVALNVAARPHPDGIYVRLFKAARAKRIAAKLYGHRLGAISTFDLSSEDDTLYTGLISSYVDFDRDAPWFNVAKGTRAEDDEVEAVQLPEDLRPELKQGFYAFSTKNHRFVFESTFGSPTNVANMLYTILNDKRVRQEGEHVNVAVEQEKEALSRLLALKEIWRLTIEVGVPNSDDGDDEQEEFEERLRKIRAKKMVTIVEGSRGEGIDPDAELKTMANVALSHGSVHAVGKNTAGKKEKLSTIEHPKTHTDQYSPDEESGKSAFRRLARFLLGRVG
jgi:uncharacterized protein DUF4747